MLVDFSVQNFRSIAEAQTLSMLANRNDKSHPHNIVTGGSEEQPLLKLATIYGANAAGKSNLLKALDFAVNYVTSSAGDFKAGSSTGVTPFRFGRDELSSPSTFEFSFILDGVRYEYGFAATSTRVVSEELRAFPRGVAQTWFSRIWSEEAETYIYSYSRAHFKAKREVESITPQNVLYLTVAATVNQQIRKVHSWFEEGIQVIFMSEQKPTMFQRRTAGLLKRLTYRKPLVDLILCADMGIEDVIVSEKPYQVPESVTKLLSESFVQKLVSEMADEKEYDIQFVHSAPALSAEERMLPSDEESDGTQRFFSLSGYIMATLMLGHLLVVDEIDSSLHPLLLRQILERFQRGNGLVAGGQLICTTHDTTVLDQSLLRRDQVYFVEKDQRGASHFYPLTDFTPRKDEALGKGYLAGRYGAVPFFGSDIWPSSTSDVSSNPAMKGKEHPVGT